MSSKRGHHSTLHKGSVLTWNCWQPQWQPFLPEADLPSATNSKKKLPYRETPLHQRQGKCFMLIKCPHTSVLLSEQVRNICHTEQPRTQEYFQEEQRRALALEGGGGIKSHDSHMTVTKPQILTKSHMTVTRPQVLNKSHMTVSTCWRAAGSWETVVRTGLRQQSSLKFLWHQFCRKINHHCNVKITRARVVDHAESLAGSFR